MKRDCFIPDCISFIHSFTLYGRFLRSDWESLLEGGCTSLAVPYPAGWGTGHCCHCEHRVGLGGCREETTTEEAFKSVLFSLKKTHSASLTFNKIRGIKEGNDMPWFSHLVFPLHSWRVAIIFNTRFHLITFQLNLLSGLPMSTSISPRCLVLLWAGFLLSSEHSECHSKSYQNLMGCSRALTGHHHLFLTAMSQCLIRSLLLLP